jgi:hypothetical protein
MGLFVGSCACVSFQAKFIRATRLARIEKVVRKILLQGVGTDSCPAMGSKAFTAGDDQL